MDDGTSIKKKKDERSFEERYAQIMEEKPIGPHPQLCEWEKQGDIYKQYSLYDLSKYETHTSSIIK